MIDLGRRILASQPFSVMLGTKLAALSDGTAKLVLPVQDRFKHQHGPVHGGVVSYLADNAMAFAAGSLLGERVVTARSEIDFRRPAQGEELRAMAEVVAVDGRKARCRCQVVSVADGEETLCATAAGIVVGASSPD